MTFQTIMATIKPGIITSFAFTRQAMDNRFTTALTGFTEDSRSVILDVMANDLGGSGKSLWSLDDGISAGGIAPTDLTVQDAIGAVQYSARGTEIRITVDGKVSYTMTTASTASFQSLEAGQIGTDTFTYAIRLSDGTISLASTFVEIMGTNHAAVITGTSTASLSESNAAQKTGGTLSATDVDSSAAFTAQTGVAGSSGYGSFAINAAGVGTYTLNNANTAVQALNTSSVPLTDSFTVLSADGTKTSVQVTINGTNDAAILSSAIVVLAETNAAVTTGGKIGAEITLNRIACETGRG